MKINYIKQYVFLEAIDKYIDTKIWKIEGRAPGERPASLEKYLASKMESFIGIYPIEKREEVKVCFEKKLNEVAAKNIQFPIRNFVKNELLKRIRARFETCFPGFVHKELPYEVKHRDEWKQEDSWIVAYFKIEKSKGGSPKVWIDLINSIDNTQKNRGRAAQILTIFVQELQRDRDPHAEISLHAWSGSNTSMPRARGAYIWSCLGFEAYEYTKQDREDGCSGKPAMDRLKEKYFEKLNDFGSINRFFEDLAKYEGKTYNPDEFLKSYVRIKEVVLEKFQKARYPWDIAEMCVENYPFGKYFMTQVSEGYRGVLYPNLHNSPGMIQYKKKTTTC